MSTRRIELVFAAPVPVGHRVELTWWAEADKGRLLTRAGKRMPFVPELTDLDTGVVWVAAWTHASASGRRSHEVLELGPRRGDVTVVGRLVGRVRACSIATVTWAEVTQQTALELEVEEESGETP